MNIDKTEKEQLILPKMDRKYEVLVKTEEETNPSYGHNPNERPITELLKCCFVNLDKPAGPTSHQAADYVKKILKAEKAGHSGTLDPKVTGVLAVGVGRAAKLSQLLLPAGKEYVGIMHLHEDVSEDLLKETINQFIGEIEQLPPIKSAVKRQLRKRSVYYFQVIVFLIYLLNQLFRMLFCMGECIALCLHLDYSGIEM